MYSLLSALLALAFLPAVLAQFIRRRRPTIGRIIAGCVVAALCLIFFGILVLCLIRRRRRARALAVQQGQQGYPNRYQGYYGDPHLVTSPPQNGLSGGSSVLPDSNYATQSSRADRAKYAPNQLSYYLPDAPPPAYTKGEPQLVGAYRN